MTTLKAALQEAYFMELEEMPSEEKLSEDEALTFSSAFEQKMKRLIRRADHPIRYRIAQIAACLLLAALLSGCTVLAISPAARAAFVGWVREVSEGWFVYRYTGEDQTVPENVVYCPTWVPDGYELITEPENRTHMIAIYENPEGDTILFNCYMNTESMNLQIGEDTQLIDTYVSNIPADLYIGNTSGAVNHLIWEDENKQMIFWIASTLDGETMVKIAESVEAQTLIIESDKDALDIVNIIDRTKTEGLPYDMAEEKFFEDGDNEYYFSGIYSHYVIVHYGDGSQEDIVTALNTGKAIISDLDKFGVSYTVKPSGMRSAELPNNPISQTEAEEAEMR